MSLHARLVNTRCIRMLESITPDHHVVLQNNEPRNGAQLGGTRLLKF